MARRVVVMPSVEVGMVTGHLIEHLVEVGSAVTVGQSLFVVEAEKVTLEIEAPVAGRVVEIQAAPGTDVPVGAPVLVIEVA